MMSMPVKRVAVVFPSTGYVTFTWTALTEMMSGTAPMITAPTTKTALIVI